MSQPLSRLLRDTAAVTLAAWTLSCSSPSGPRFSSILLHQATWHAQKLVNYSYTYEFHAFNSLADQPLRLEVIQDTVRSVVVLATGERIAPATYFPTIDALFDAARRATQNGSLRAITFDPVRGYPTLLSYAALPDALSAQEASGLQPLP
jgi:hypothetical protein